jgi:hypothetical protein
MNRIISKSYVIEWLQLRSTTDQCPSWYEALTNLLETTDLKRGLVEATMYLNAEIPGDATLLLVWDRFLASAGSTLAVGIKHQLKRYGLVDHSVWIPQLRIFERAQDERDEETR